MTLFELLQDASARIIRAEEALEDGERDLAWEILRDLEVDVVGGLAAWEGWAA